jgi:hypothetical protein
MPKRGAFLAYKPGAVEKFRICTLFVFILFLLIPHTSIRVESADTLMGDLASTLRLILLL